MRAWIQNLSKSEDIIKNYVSDNLIKELVFDLKKENVLAKNKIEYINTPVCFDIETSSFYRFSQLNSEYEKVAIMYEWCICICGKFIVGRKWDDFIYLCEQLSAELNLNEQKRLIIYVHNLAFEFQFMQHRFEWLQVFSLDQRKPVKALTMLGIEFRCSYILSGYSLAKLSDQLVTYQLHKMEGDLDYDLIRNYKTPLTEKEWYYCIIDTLVVVAYIDELLDRYRGIINLPLTKTGFVRDYCRAKCLHNKGEDRDNDKYHKYRKIMRRLTIDGEDEYLQLKRAFAGGYTHANANYMGKTIPNCKSYDFTSSYPYVLLSEKFPMSKSEKIEVQSTEQIFSMMKNYCCLFDIEFEQIECKVDCDTYISKSHCNKISNPLINNGRVAYADKLSITLTEIDFDIIYETYKWKDAKISNFRRYRKEYLPTDFIKCVLEFYNKKTQLKGVVGKEVEYLVSKENVNSLFGMTVTDICRDEILYDDGWESNTPEIEESIMKYNKSLRRFLFYPWGVWVTAYARRNLWTGILEFGNDYIYSDTDSVKVINAENHQEYIQSYNNLVILKLRNAMNFHKLPFSLVEPKNKKGEKKLIGIWDDDGEYSKFKTLGAKRYMIERIATPNDYKNNPTHIYNNYFYNLTVSGLNKNTAIPYLLRNNKTQIFNKFKEGLYIPPQYTGKLTHTYIDYEQEGIITDYLGNTAEYKELSSTHLEKQDYNLSISDDYARYIAGIKSKVL